MLALGLLISYSTHIEANIANETTGIQQNNTYKVSGVVTDTNGEPVIGASIVEKGTSIGTITDLDGKFVLEVSAGATLNISYIGYKSQEVKVDRNGLSLKLTLKEDTETLDEVIVVGYGTVRKADLAGSVAVMDNKSFKDQPVTRISEALQGRVSGVQVENSGVPGGDIRIRVRGANSVNLSNEPLYVVDGIVHYAVANIPGAVPFTSTMALTNSTLPYTVALADKGWQKACKDDPALAQGLNVVEGKVTYKAVADVFGLEYEPIEL